MPCGAENDLFQWPFPLNLNILRKLSFENRKLICHLFLKYSSTYAMPTRNMPRPVTMNIFMFWKKNFEIKTANATPNRTLITKIWYFGIIFSALQPWLKCPVTCNLNQRFQIPDPITPILNPISCTTDRFLWKVQSRFNRWEKIRVHPNDSQKNRPTYEYLLKWFDESVK